MTGLLDVAYWVVPPLVVAAFIVRSEIRINRRKKHLQEGN